MGETRSDLAGLFEREQTAAVEVIVPPDPAPRVFIAAPAAVDTGVIRRALEARGMVPYEIDDRTMIGASIAEVIEDCIGQADLVVAVIGGGQAQANVLYELGYAAALKKRILALVPPDEDLPIAGIPCLRVRPDNREAIDFGLDLVLNAPPRDRPPPGEPAGQTRPLGRLADDLLARLAEAMKQPDEEELTEIVLEALNSSGISSLSCSSQTSRNDGGVDVGIWSDDFEPWVGNPVFIEIRSRLTSPALSRTLEQLTHRLDRTQTSWGLLLYGTADLPLNAEALRHPRIFVMGIGEFLRSLRDTGLGPFLTERRNLRVHGRG